MTEPENDDPDLRGLVPWFEWRLRVGEAVGLTALAAGLALIAWLVIAIGATIF